MGYTIGEFLLLFHPAHDFIDAGPALSFMFSRVKFHFFIVQPGTTSFQIAFSKYSKFLFLLVVCFFLTFFQLSFNFFMLPPFLNFPLPATLHITFGQE